MNLFTTKSTDTSFTSKPTTTYPTTHGIDERNEKNKGQHIA